MSSTDLATAANHSTLVQYVEIWHLDDDKQTMQLQDYARMRDCIAESGRSERRVCSGDGVVGMAWHQKRAIILQEAPSDLLRRIGNQNGLKLSALIALPILRGQEVLSVVVFGISDGPGAFEVWSRDDRDELSISSSYYSGLKNLEFISRYVRFPKGAGLPGAVWKSGQPRLAANLVGNSAFMRSCEADETDLNTGVGLPVGSAAGNSDSVLLLLSSVEKPISNAFEVWNPSSSSGDVVEFQRVASDGISTTDDTLVREAWTSGRPVLASSTANAASETRARMGVTLAIPVYRGTELVSVVVFVF